MLKLHIIQAKFGDCMILEFGSEERKPRYILIDGGPDRTYDDYLNVNIQSIRSGADGKKRLDIVIASHVDNDHLIGLIDFLADLRRKREEEENGIEEGDKIVSVGGLWHNSFCDTMESENISSSIARDAVDDNIPSKLESLLDRTKSSASNININSSLTAAEDALVGIREGRQLSLLARILGIAINPGFPKGLILAEESSNSVEIDNLILRIIGPTKSNLEELRKEWLRWLEKYETADISEPTIAAMADKSIPNLSSIVILAEADGKSILFTGDARGDHIMEGLKLAGLLDQDGHFHVDVLKVPHHGSDRNVTKTFFKTLTSDAYIISADGKYGNPDFSTLKWIIEAAQERKSSIEIFVTNDTPAIKRLTQQYPPEQSGYHIVVMDKNATTLPIKFE